VERDHDRVRDEDAFRIQRSRSLRAALIEAQFDARRASSAVVALATGFAESSLHVDMTLEVVPRIEINRDTCGGAFYFRIALNTIVDWDCGNHREAGGAEN
jgi:hypothetical protein